jgi:hypothetical protein
MRIKSKIMMTILLIATVLPVIQFVSAKPPSHAKIPADNPNIPGHLVPGDEGYVYVYTQQKYYRTIVPITPSEGLPHPTNAPFQLVEATATGALFETEFGPGDQGYVGGRWYDPSGPYWFLCPLVGPALDELPQ